jgi:hypothetical protein
VSVVDALVVSIATSALAATAAGTFGRHGRPWIHDHPHPGRQEGHEAEGRNVHNFHLSGPGVNKKTSVTALTKTMWKVTLKKGTYKFMCDPNAPLMNGGFTVT